MNNKTWNISSKIVPEPNINVEVIYCSGKFDIGESQKFCYDLDATDTDDDNIVHMWRETNITKEDLFNYLESKMSESLKNSALQKPLQEKRHRIKFDNQYIGTRYGKTIWKQYSHANSALKRHLAKEMQDVGIKFGLHHRLIEQTYYKIIEHFKNNNRLQFVNVDKNSGEVWIVKGETGEYSDFQEWIVAAYSSESEAQKHCDAAQKEAEIANISESYRFRARFNNKYDDKFLCEYNGTKYRVDRVDFLNEFIEI